MVLGILAISIYIFSYHLSICRTKVCLWIIGKKENLYANEYINHYKNLGYKHIYLYDNNDINDERFEDVLKREIKKNFVSIINYRGFRGLQNHPQFNAYYDCYEKNNKKYQCSLFWFWWIFRIKTKKY